MAHNPRRILLRLRQTIQAAAQESDTLLATLQSAKPNTPLTVRDLHHIAAHGNTLITLATAISNATRALSQNPGQDS